MGMVNDFESIVGWVVSDFDNRVKWWPVIFECRV